MSIVHAFKTFEVFVPSGDYYATVDAISETTEQLRQRLIDDDGFPDTITLRERETP